MSGISVNTNISALQSLSALENTTSQLNMATEQLSTGLSINNPGDNPSGEAIVQTMTAQINGLNAAQQNAQNGLSVLQTAGGAMGTVSTILQNLNTLAVTAANTATESTGDLALIQSQMTQLTSELDRMASTVTFNGQNLLDGSYTGEALQVSNNSKGGINFNAADPNQIAIGLSGISTANLNLTGLNITGNGAGTAASATGVVLSAVSLTAPSAVLALSAAAAFTSASTLATVFGATDASFAAANAGTLTVDGHNVAYSGSETIATLTTALAASGITATLAFTGSTTGTLTLTPTTGTGPTAALSISDSNVTVSGILSAGTGSGTFTTADGGYSTASQSLNSATTLGGLVSSKAADAVTAAGSLTINGQSFAYTSSTTIGSLLSAINADAAAGVTGSLTTTGPNAGSVQFVSTATGTGAAIAISDSNGAGSGSAMGALGLVAAATTAGTSSSAMTAASAIEVITSAINQVATETGQIGAVMDRLNFTVSNLGNEVQNTTASQGTIEDVNMAQEMSTFTQLQILQQSGTAMLAQANQAPSLILKLIQ
jgi:flagellin